MFLSKSLFQTLPKVVAKPVRFWDTFLLLSALMQLFAWYFALFLIGADTDQGDVYRILFVHVSVAWCAFFWFFASAFFGLRVFFQRDQQKAKAHDFSSHTSMEMALVFSSLVLMTGSFWGRPTWGVWWDWDPRLTSSLVLFLMGCGYLLLRYFTPQASYRIKISAIVSIISSINVPIVYYSVNLWRSVHQPQTFVQRTHNASGDIQLVLLINLMATFLLSIALYKVRRQSISLQETLQEFRGYQ